MHLKFEPQAFLDLQHWIQYEPKLAKKLMRLIEESIETPFDGIGKPEPLKGDLAGWWSKRIDGEHRLIYKVDGNDLIILKAKGHYDDK